jgi:hypothetical protein
MSPYTIPVFVHLLGALALFVGYGIEWGVSALFQNAASAEQLRSWLRVFKISPPLSGAGLLVLLLSGGYLASLSPGTMRQGWISAAFLGIIVALALGFALILPRMRGIRSALPAGNESLPAALRTRLGDPVLLTAIRVRVMLATGIVYLMVAKNPLIPSLVALGVAAILGALLSVSTWRQKAAA